MPQAMSQLLHIYQDSLHHGPVEEESSLVSKNGEGGLQDAGSIWAKAALRWEGPDHMVADGRAFLAEAWQAQMAPSWVEWQGEQSGSWAQEKPKGQVVLACRSP